MEKQEFYRFNIKALRSFFTPKKYEVFDDVTQELKFTSQFEGKAKFRCFLYDHLGKGILAAQKLKWMKTSNDWVVIKDEEEIAKFGKYPTNFLPKGHELKTKSQIYRSTKGNFSDEEGREVFIINFPERLALIAHKEIFVDVNQNFDVNMAIMISLLFLFSYLESV